MQLDALALNAETNTTLFEVARAHQHDHEVLRTIRAVVSLRGPRASRDDLLAWIDKQLATPLPPVKPKPINSKIWKYVAGAAAVVAVGVGQAMGSELWKTIWPKVETLVTRLF